MYPLAAALPMMVCLVWTAILLLELPGSDKARRALALFGVNVTILYTCHYLYFSNLGSWWIECIYIFCTLAAYPLYNFYVRCLTRKGFRISRFVFWFIPSLVLGLWCFFAGLTGKDLVRVQMYTMLLIPVIALANMVDANVSLQRFRRQIKNYYADVEGKTLDPILTLMVLLLIMAIITSCSTLIGREHFYGSLLLFIPAILFSVLLFSIFFVGHNTGSPLEETLLPDRPDNARLNPAAQISLEQQKALMARIERQMTDNQLFRKKGLLISDVAEAVGSNRTYVSNCINQQAGMTFSDYVNKKRTDYILSLMKDSENISLTEMAEKAGYSDRSSFYRSFKKVTGLSPSDFLQKKG